MEVSAMVLAAGYGRRLAPLTDELPKPLVPVGDRSVLAHVLDALSDAGVRRAVVNAHHLPGAVEAEASAHPLVAATVTEPTLRGTAGGVAGARAQLGPGPVLAHNGDILADVDLAALLGRFEADAPFSALALSERLPPGRGTVGLGDGGAIVRLRDRRFGVERESAAFCGIQVLSVAARERLPDSGCLVGDVHIPALAEGERLLGVRCVAWFDDIGTPASYLAANLRWLGGRASWLGRGVSAEAVTMVDSLAGPGARLSGRGALERCVVWPGAEAVAPLSDAIVTPLRTLAVDR